MFFFLYTDFFAKIFPFTKYPKILWFLISKFLRMELFFFVQIFPKENSFSLHIFFWIMIIPSKNISETKFILITATKENIFVFQISLQDFYFLKFLQTKIVFLSKHCCLEKLLLLISTSFAERKSFFFL